MSWTLSGNNEGTAQNKTAATTIALTPLVNFAASDVIIVAVGIDNTSATDGNTSEVSSITDSVGGNTWTLIREFCNGQGAAKAGATTSLWYSILTNGITTGDTITANLANSITAKAIACWKATFAAGSTISVVATQDIASDAAVPSGLSITGLASQQYLFVIATAVEQGAPSGVFTSYNTVHIETSGGGAASNMGCNLALRVLTGTGDSPTQSGYPSTDMATVFVALKEVTSAGFALTGGIVMR